MTENVSPVFYAKDFIETKEGLVFAVVVSSIEENKVLCFLRYAKQHNGWHKLDTDKANTLLKQQHGGYLHYSKLLDAHLHAVAVENIVKHHQPRLRLQEIMQANLHDAIENDLLQLGNLLRNQGLDLSQIGVTGSILIGAQKHTSDIDLVCYDRKLFHQCRDIVASLINKGRLQKLNAGDWQEAYGRRACALSFDEYVWHEQRKHNKAMINGRKFDLSLIDAKMPTGPIKKHQKSGAIILRCKVLDDSRGFDYPAEFALDHAHIRSVVSFTATYTGQALRGETVEISGMLENSPQGQRIVVGANREADGEYIKVLHD